MAFTRFSYDECRTKKQLQQSTDQGRWILDVPGNGDTPCYIEDPQIIIQKWGANLRTNTVNVESDLLGVNRGLGRDSLAENYKKHNVSNSAIQYPTCSNVFTAQSRTTNPAWWYRDLEQVAWEYPPIDPQINTCLPFQNNLSTRILEKDYYTPKRDCIVNETKNYLPASFNLISGGYVGGPVTCQQTNSCETL